MASKGGKDDDQRAESTASKIDNPYYMCNFYGVFPDEKQYNGMSPIKYYTIHPTRTWILVINERDMIGVWDYKIRSIIFQSSVSDLLNEVHTKKYLKDFLKEFKEPFDQISKPFQYDSKFQLDHITCGCFYDRDVIFHSTGNTNFSYNENYTYVAFGGSGGIIIYNLTTKDIYYKSTSNKNIVSIQTCAYDTLVFGTQDGKIGFIHLSTMEEVEVPDKFYKKNVCTIIPIPQYFPQCYNEHEVKTDITIALFSTAGDGTFLRFGTRLGQVVSVVTKQSQIAVPEKDNIQQVFYVYQTHQLYLYTATQNLIIYNMNTEGDIQAFMTTNIPNEILSVSYSSITNIPGTIYAASEDQLFLYNFQSRSNELIITISDIKQSLSGLKVRSISLHPQYSNYLLLNTTLGFFVFKLYNHIIPQIYSPTFQFKYKPTGVSKMVTTVQNDIPNCNKELVKYYMHFSNKAKDIISYIKDGGCDINNAFYYISFNTPYSSPSGYTNVVQNNYKPGLYLNILDVNEKKYQSIPYNILECKIINNILIHEIPYTTYSILEQPQLLWNSDQSHVCLLWRRNNLYSIYEVLLYDEDTKTDYNNIKVKIVDSGKCKGFAWGIYPSQYALLPDGQTKTNKVEFHDFEDDKTTFGALFLQVPAIGLIGGILLGVILEYPKSVGVDIKVQFYQWKPEVPKVEEKVKEVDKTKKADNSANFGGLQFTSKIDKTAIDDVFGAMFDEKAAKKNLKEKADKADEDEVEEEEEVKETKKVVQRDPFMKNVGSLINLPKQVSYNQNNSMCAILLDTFTHIYEIENGLKTVSIIDRVPVSAYWHYNILFISCEDEIIMVLPHKTGTPIFTLASRTLTTQNINHQVSYSKNDKMNYLYLSNLDSMPPPVLMKPGYSDIIGLHNDSLILRNENFVYAISLNHSILKSYMLLGIQDVDRCLSWTSQLGPEHQNNIAFVMIKRGFAGHAISLPYITLKTKVTLLLELNLLKELWELFQMSSNISCWGPEEAADDISGIPIYRKVIIAFAAAGKLEYIDFLAYYFIQNKRYEDAEFCAVFLHKVKPQLLMEAMELANHPSESAMFAKKSKISDAKSAITKWRDLLNQYSKKCPALRNYNFTNLIGEEKSGKKKK